MGFLNLFGASENLDTTRNRERYEASGLARSLGLSDRQKEIDAYLDYCERCTELGETPVEMDEWERLKKQDVTAQDANEDWEPPTAA
jgi:hypothetical protein